MVSENSLYDLVMRDTDFVIYCNQKPLTTRSGREFAHDDARLLRHLLIALTINGDQEWNRISSCTLFAFWLDHLNQNVDPVLSDFEQLMQEDPLIAARINTAKSDDPMNAEALLENLNESNRTMELKFLSASVIMRGVKSIFSEMANYKSIEQDFAGHREEISGFLRSQYDLLPAEKKAAVNLLSHVHGTGILLPLMLLQSGISASEYAVSALANQGKSKALRSRKSDEVAGTLFGLKKIWIDYPDPGRCYAVLHEEALKALEYVGYFGNEARKMSVISELIAKGEHEKLEFKSTFRWDLRQDKKNPAIEHAALKSIAAFLNSDGGDLLIGVADDGSIVGIERDNFPNDDKFLLHVWMLIKTSLGKDISPYITTTLEKLDGLTVCRIHCMRSPNPVFLRQSGYEVLFYIRIGPSSGNLDISEALQYIKDHF